MTYVINANYGEFEAPIEIINEIGCDFWLFGYLDSVRTDKRLIEWVRANKGKTDLAIVNIPDNATDWEVDEDDGLETITAVIDGKIVHLGHE